MGVDFVASARIKRVHSGSGVVVDKDEMLESQSVLWAKAVTIVAEPIQAAQALLQYRWWSRILASNPKSPSLEHFARSIEITSLQFFKDRIWMELCILVKPSASANHLVP